MSLPRLDLSTLSHNATKWPLPAKALLGCALAAVVLWVGDGLVMGPSRERLAAAEAREVVLQHELEQKAGVAWSLESRTRQVQLMQAKVSGLLRQLPGVSDMPGLLDDIARLAAANGLVVEGVTVVDEKPGALYVEEPVQLSVFGGFHDLAAFVSALGGLSRFVTVHDLALRRDGSMLRLDLLAKAYRSSSPHGKPGLAVEPGERFVYAAASLRDPFQSPALQFDHVPGRPALAPDLTRARGALEGLAVDRFEMVGTLSRGEQTFVLLRAASKVHRLAVGDYLGPNHGRVTAIQAGHIELAELFPDEQGAWLERSRTLLLNVNS